MKNDIEKLQDLISKNQVGDAIEKASTLVKDDDGIKDELITLLRRYNENKRNASLGILSRSDENIESNAITVALLSILRNIEEQ